MVDQHTETGRDELNRIFWHSRRGMLELDLLLVPFAQEHYATLPKYEQEQYQALLACEDADIFTWLMGHKTPEREDLHNIVQRIMHVRNAQHSTPDE